MYRTLFWLNLSAVFNPCEIGIYKQTWIKYVCLSKVASVTLNDLCCTWEKSSCTWEKNAHQFLWIFLRGNFRIEICSNQYSGSQLLISLEATSTFHGCFQCDSLGLMLPSLILFMGKRNMLFFIVTIVYYLPFPYPICKRMCTHVHIHTHRCTLQCHRELWLGNFRASPWCPWGACSTSTLEHFCSPFFCVTLDSLTCVPSFSNSKQCGGIMLATFG